LLRCRYDTFRNSHLHCKHSLPRFRKLLRFTQEWIISSLVFFHGRPEIVCFILMTWSIWWIFFHSSLWTPRRATSIYGSRLPWKSEPYPCKVNKLTPGRSLLSRRLSTQLKHHFNRWLPPILPELNFLQVSFVNLRKGVTFWVEAEAGFEPKLRIISFRED